MIVQQLTNIIPNTIAERRRLALTAYRLTHGCSISVLKDLFGASQSLGTECFKL